MSNKDLLMSRPKPFVFVLMPFDAAFDDVYKLGIRAACSDAGAYCERVDEQIFHESILERVYNQIGKADLLIADMTGRNPNVFYEVGYAHALGKRVFLLTRNADDIPFDLKHYPHIVYGGSISGLKDELAKRIRWAVEHPEASLSSVEPRLNLFVGSTEVSEGISLTIPYRNSGHFFSVQIHNPTDRVVNGADIRIALVTPGSVSSGPWHHRVIPLPDGRHLHEFPEIKELFPGGWESSSLELHSHDSAPMKDYDHGIPASLRLVTRVGVKDYTLALKFERTAT